MTAMRAAKQATDGQSDRGSRHAPSQQLAQIWVSCPPFPVLDSQKYTHANKHIHAYTQQYMPTCCMLQCVCTDMAV